MKLEKTSAIHRLTEFTRMSKQIIWLLFSLQFIVHNVAKHSLYYQIIAGLFIVVGFVFLYFHKAIIFSKYHISIILFIIYNLALILCGVTIDPGHSLRMVITVSLNLILSIIIYSYLVFADDTEKLLKIYIYSSLISIVIILYIFKDSLFLGRLAFSWKDNLSSYKLLGLEVITAGPNLIAFFSAISFILATYLFMQKKMARYLLYDIIFLFTILITGSRKGMFVAAAGFIITLLILSKGQKKWMVIVSGLAFCALMYMLSQIIPALYNIMGSRLNELLNLIMGKPVADSSINTRLALIEMAIAYFRERPLFGYGLDSFRLMCPWNIVTDSNYLDIVISSGLVGGLIYYSYAIMVLYDYFSIKNKTEIYKIFFWLFILTLIIEFGSVTYFERTYVFMNTIHFYLLKKRGALPDGDLTSGELECRMA